MTDERKRKLNAALSDAFEPKPRPEEAGNYRWNTDYWRFTLPPTELTRYDFFTGDRQWVPRYDFFTDGNAMLKLIEAMRFRGWYWSGEGTIDLKCRAAFRNAAGVYSRDWVEAKTLPEATALAAARTLGIEVPV